MNDERKSLKRSDRLFLLGLAMLTGAMAQTRTACGAVCCGLGAFFMYLAATACTDTTTKTLAAPPLAADLPGAYAVAWHSSSGSTSTGAARIAAGAIAFEPFPCFLSGGQDQLGGAFDYDETNGHFAVEMKTADGALKLTVEGFFASGAELQGSYRSDVLAAECERGSIELRRTGS